MKDTKVRQEVLLARTKQIVYGISTQKTVLELMIILALLFQEEN